jgi:hypothetical protein
MADFCSSAVGFDGAVIALPGHASLAESAKIGIRNQRCAKPSSSATPRPLATDAFPR